MKKTENMTVTELLANYPTIESVINDTELYQVERARIFCFMFEDVFKNKSLKEKRKFFKELTSYTIPLTPYGMAYLYDQGVIEILYSDAADAENHNRRFDDWDFGKNEVGYAISTYNVACKPDEKKKSPLHLGNLNNFVVRIFEKNGKIYLSNEDGGHRCYFFWKIYSGIKFPMAKSEEGLSNELAKKFNDMFADKSIDVDEENEYLKKMLNEAILPIVFEDENYNASERNITKPHNNNDSIALNYKANPLWFDMRKTLIENDIHFAKNNTDNVIAGLFHAAKIMRLCKGSKYNVIRYLLDNQEFVDRRDELIRNVVEYARLYNSERITFLKKFGKGKKKGYYHTYRAQAFIGGVQLALLENPAQSVVYNTFKTEYKNAVDNKTKHGIVDGQTATFAQFFDKKYCAYRQTSTIDAHFIIANDTIRYISYMKPHFIINNDNIDQLLELHNQHQGSGHQGCENSVVEPLMRCLVYGEWDKFLPVPEMPAASDPKDFIDGGAVNA